MKGCHPLSSVTTVHHRCHLRYSVGISRIILPTTTTTTWTTWIQPPPSPPPQQRLSSSSSSSSSASSESFSLSLSSNHHHYRRQETNKKKKNTHLDATEASAPRIRMSIGGHKVVVVNYVNDAIPFHCYRCNTSKTDEKTIFQWKTRKHGIKIICLSCHEELTRIARRNWIHSRKAQSPQKTMEK